MINICIYEDQEYLTLYPLTFMQPAYELRIGIDTLLDKQKRFFNEVNITLHCRDYLKSVLQTQHKDLPINNINTGAPCLFINGRVIMSDELFTTFSQIDENQSYLFTQNGHVIATYLRGDLLDSMVQLLKKTPDQAEIIQLLRTRSVTQELENVGILHKPWDGINLNLDTLISDFHTYNQPGIIKGNIQPYATIYEENNVYIGKGAQIEDFVVLNAQNGPIYIEENAIIESHSRIEGPAYIGQNTHVLSARIKGCSIGPHCKVGGELSNTIIQGYSNKAHAGFVGNSHIGSWVNLGAMTTTSNLKNSYGNVKVETAAGTEDTQQQFLGSIIGDHTKTSIGTLLNTGTIIHYGSTLFDAGFHKKLIQPFTWGSPQSYDVHDIKKFLSTATTMMNRRSKELSPVEKDIIIYLHSIHTK